MTASLADAHSTPPAAVPSDHFSTVRRVPRRRPSMTGPARWRAGPPSGDARLPEPFLARLILPALGQHLDDRVHDQDVGDDTDAEERDEHRERPAERARRVPETQDVGGKEHGHSIPAGPERRPVTSSASRSMPPAGFEPAHHGL